MCIRDSRLAGVLTLLDDPDAAVISASALANGIALSMHYAKTALRLHGASLINAELLEAEALLAWLQGKWWQEQGPIISLPEIVKYGPNSTRDTSTARRLIAILEEHRHLKRLKEPTQVMGKIRREVWQIKEHVFAGGLAELAEAAEPSMTRTNFPDVRDGRSNTLGEAAC